jgi:hypothetical protein
MRLTYLSVYHSERRDGVSESAPFPSGPSSITHVHRWLGSRHPTPVPTLLAHVYTQHTIPHSPHVHGPHFHVNSCSLVSYVFGQVSCVRLWVCFLLLWIKKARAKDKTYIWGSVRWKTEKLKFSTLTLVYYESIKREPKIRGINKCRCDERLQTKGKEFTRLPYTGLVLELEHLKIETRLISERFANAMGECEN